MNLLMVFLFVFGMVVSGGPAWIGITWAGEDSAVRGGDSGSPWSVATEGRVNSSPAVANLDGDNHFEIAVSITDADGANHGVYIYSSFAELERFLPTTYQTTTYRIDASPAIADVIPGGGLELVAADYFGHIHVWNPSTGSYLPGWPKGTLGDPTIQALQLQLT